MPSKICLRRRGRRSPARRDSRTASCCWDCGLHGGHQRRSGHPLGPPGQDVDIDPIRRRRAGKLAARSPARRPARLVAVALLDAATGLVARHGRRIFLHARRPARRLLLRRVDQLRHRVDRRLRLWRTGRRGSGRIRARRRFRRRLVEGRGLCTFQSEGLSGEMAGELTLRYGSQCNDDCVDWSPSG